MKKAFFPLIFIFWVVTGVGITGYIIKEQVLDYTFDEQPQNNINNTGSVVENILGGASGAINTIYDSVVGSGQGFSPQPEPEPEPEPIVEPPTNNYAGFTTVTSMSELTNTINNCQPNNNCKILLKAGSYSSPGLSFTKKKNIQIVAENMNAIITITGANPGISFTDSSNIIIDGITIRGDNKALEGIEYRGVDNSIVRNVKVYNVRHSGIKFNGNCNFCTSGAKANNNLVYNSLVDGALWNGIDFYFTTNSKAYDNEVKNIKFVGIYFGAGGKNNWAYQNLVHEVQEDCMQIFAWKDGALPSWAVSYENLHFANTMKNCALDTHGDGNMAIGALINHKTDSNILAHNTIKDVGQVPGAVSNGDCVKVSEGGTNTIVAYNDVDGCVKNAYSLFPAGSGVAFGNTAKNFGSTFFSSTNSQWKYWLNQDVNQYININKATVDSDSNWLQLGRLRLKTKPVSSLPTTCTRNDVVRTTADVLHFCYTQNKWLNMKTAEMQT